MTGRFKARCVAGLRDERGATAVFFAVGLLLLAPATMGLIDLYMITTQRGQLQDALDTATLYVARSTATTSTEIQTKGDEALRANLKLPDGQDITSTTFKLADDKVTITGEATIEPPSVGLKLWDQADIRAKSEVMRNSNNIEVALVLDTTGSMDKSMENLRTAARDLVELVVKDKQPPDVPYYTKVALVPYAVGVNAGPFADQARGTLVGPTTIASIYVSNSKVMVQSVNHGLKTGERVQLQGVSNPKSNSQSMNTDYTVTRESADVFSLDSASTKLSGTYGGGGKAYCLREGCEKFRFTNMSSSWKIFSAGKCVSERTGTDAYSDAAPSVSPVGRLYDGGSGNPCASAEIVPLTSKKDVLTGRIASLTHAGSTAGQIGLAWGWYMVSPEWKGVWADEVSKAADYNKPQTLKVVILMTDGAFNSPYCKGVIASDATSGSGNDSDHIKNCNATNGNPFTQAATLCTKMKAKGIIIYTVGFNVGSETAVKNLMNNCATSPEYVYMPDNGDQLKVAFRAIAQDINSLRIVK